MPGRVRPWVSAVAKGLLAPAPSCATSPGPAAIRVTTWVEDADVSRTNPRVLPPRLREAVGLFRQASRITRRTLVAPTSDWPSLADSTAVPVSATLLVETASFGSR